MKKNLSAVITAAALILGSAAANASIIYFEDFESATGTTFITGGFGTTEREAGSYSTNVTLPGWTLSSASSTYVHDGSSGNTSVLLNSIGSGISRTISGLTAGLAHQLTFEYWGDNTSYVGTFQGFVFEIDGSVTPITRAATGLATGNFGSITYDFTATSSSTLLRFTETGGYGTVFDNIAVSSVSVPEPGTLALFAIGLAAAGASRRRSKREPK